MQEEYFLHTKKPGLHKQAGNGNAAAIYSPGPSPAKYAAGKRVPCGDFGAAESDPQAASETSGARASARRDD